MSGPVSPVSCERPPSTPAWRHEGAAPLFATPRDSSRPTEGRQVGLVAAALGTPFLPWQQYVADVAGERLPNGEYAYQVIVVSVPRQSGKTTLLRAVGAHRCAVCGRDVFYTAQTGKDARERWMDLVTAVRSSDAFKGVTDIRLAAGSSRVIFPGGAAFRCFAPTAESLHGYTPPTVMLDEAFALSGPEGELLMGAIGPAQMTVVDKQLWIVSTMGTAESEFLNAWLAKAQAGAARVAGFVWGAGPEVDFDHLTPAEVAGYHPAVGFTINGKTLTAQDILDARATAGSAAEYERAYGNRLTKTASNLIPAGTWKRLAEEVPAPASTRDLILTYDVAYDRMSATVMATWRHEGVPHSRIVMAGPGYAWVAPAVQDLRESWRPRAIGADDGGAAREVTDALEVAGVEVATLGMRDLATASGRFLQRVQADDLTHDGSDLLANSVAGLVMRPSSDGLVVSRRHSTGDTSAAVSLIVGGHLLERAGTGDTTPMIYVGGAA